MSFHYAFAGGRVMVARQHNTWGHAVAPIRMVLGLFVGVTRLEWALLSLAWVWTGQWKRRRLPWYCSREACPAFRKFL